MNYCWGKEYVTAASFGIGVIVDAIVVVVGVDYQVASWMCTTQYPHTISSKKYIPSHNDTTLPFFWNLNIRLFGISAWRIVNKCFQFIHTAFINNDN